MRIALLITCNSNEFKHIETWKKFIEDFEYTTLDVFVVSATLQSKKKVITDVLSVSSIQEHFVNSKNLLRQMYVGKMIIRKKEQINLYDYCIKIDNDTLLNYNSDYRFQPLVRDDEFGTIHFFKSRHYTEEAEIITDKVFYAKSLPFMDVINSCYKLDAQEYATAHKNVMELFGNRIYFYIQRLGYYNIPIKGITL